jgi:transcriptional regulator with XRE-family HTH domain
MGLFKGKGERMTALNKPASADRFRAARLAAGLSQSEVARALGTGRHNISRIESGGHEPTPQWLLWAAAVLRLDAAALDPELAGLVENLVTARPAKTNTR